MIISGRKAIHAIIQNDSIRHLIRVVYLSPTQTYTIDLCREYRVNYEVKAKDFFDKNYGNKTKYKYKYAIAILKQQPTISLSELLKLKSKSGLVVVLDHIQDPFNLGAILRTCAAANVDGVIMPKHNIAPVNHDATLKASQGLSLFVNIVVVGNLVQAISELKKSGY